MKTKQHITTRMHHADDAVVGIVVAVMIIGLLLSVISIIQLVYVPKWMESREAEHMAIVSDQFSQLKYAIDAQCLIQQPLPMSTSITLGSKELGFLSSSKAFGRLLIETDAAVLDVYRGPTNTQYEFGTLKYVSDNQYFLDQNYIYELGAVVLNQTEGMVLSIKPSLIAGFNPVNKTVFLNLSCVTLAPLGGKTSVSGYGTYPIRTEFSVLDEINISQVSMINLTTKHPVLWMQYFNNTLSTLGLYGKMIIPPNTEPMGIYDYNITRNGNTLAVRFNTVTVDPLGELTNVIFHLRKTTINVQISPGWIQN